MNYQKIYDSLITKARSENRVKGGDIYYEAHHIIPKCMGGEGLESQWKTHNNIVLLTPREHYISHFLLWVIHPDNKKITRAFHALSNKHFRINGRKQTYHVSSRIYAKLKEQVAKDQSERRKGVKPWNTGKSVFLGENNPNYGNKWDETKKTVQGEKLKKVYEDGFTNEHINKLKKSREGKKPALGMTHTKEQKQRWQQERQGENHPQTKLKNEDVLWIRENYNHTKPETNLKGLSLKYGVSVGAIKNIVYKRTWTHLL